MKKIAFIISTLLFLYSACSAQSITNGGFENWNQNQGYDAALGWFTINHLTQQGIPATSAPTTDAAHGNSALLLETKTYSGGSVLGYTAVGDQQSFLLGTFFTSQPGYLNFYYKAFPQAGDSAWVHLELRTGFSGQVVGEIDWYESDTVSEYKFVSIPIDYKSAMQTTFLDLIFRSSYNDTFGITGSKLYVDSVFFTDQSVVSIDENRKTEIEVYPNPTSNVLSIKLSDEIGELSMMSINGQHVIQKKINSNEVQLQVGHLPRGIYILHIQNKSGLVTKKIALK